MSTNTWVSKPLELGMVKDTFSVANLKNIIPLLSTAMSCMLMLSGSKKTSPHSLTGIIPLLELV